MKSRTILIAGIILVAVAGIYYFFLRPTEQQGNGMSYGPSISADGRLVAFHSEADNLVADDGNEVSDVFMKDTESQEMERISENSAGEEGNGGSYNAAIDATGRFVAFISDASNLVPDDDNTCTERGRRFNCPDVFVKDLDSGDVTRASVNSDGDQANWKSEAAAISSGGRYVAFSSYADNLVAGDTGICLEPEGGRSCSDIFVKDMETGRISLVSGTAGGENGDGDSFGPSISADGRYVVFHSRAANLVPGDDNDVVDVFIKDIEDGSIRRVSEVASMVGGRADSYNGVVSADGSKVAFISVADNLVPGDANGKEDIFVRDMDTEEITLVSVGAAGIIAEGASSRPAITADGLRVAFDSVATNLFEGDDAKCVTGNKTPSCSDVLIKDMGNDSIMLVSADKNGAQGNWNSYSPSASDDGRYVAFASEASNLVGGDADACSDEGESWNCSDIFVKDTESGKIEMVSSASPE
jgi:Tol biopolymer transport system component